MGPRNGLGLGFFIGLWFCSSLGAFVSDPWVGVWRLRIDEKPATSTLHMVVSKDNSAYSVRLYNQLWIENELKSFSVGEQEAELLSRPVARAYRIELGLSEGGVTGTWNLVHAQYKYSVPLTGQRILEQNHWNFGEGIRAAAGADGFVDIASLILKSPRSSFAEFEEFWDESVLPTAYYLVEDSLYAEEVSAQERERKLRTLFDLVKQDGFQRFVGSFNDTRKRVVELVKEKAPQFYFTNIVASVPILEGEAISFRQFSQSPLMRIGIDSLYHSREESPELSCRLARELLKLGFYRHFGPGDQSPAGLLIREGMAARLAEQVLSSGTCKAERASPAELQKIREKLKAQRRDLPDAEILKAGYAFADRVLETHQPDEILKFDRQKWLQLVASFVSG